tara:strand:- start:376 stop:831 length:456 start_codon:yes stop_codon:yes gene_type:complete
MAISRGSGTEIIRTINLIEADSTSRALIIGVQHHIYTVLSVIFYASSLGSAGDWISMLVRGWDSLAGATQGDTYIMQQAMQAQQTFVWDNKFSFNGYEPLASSMSGATTTAAEQDAIADQASAVSQELRVDTQSASDNIQIVCTYIDQNNA